MRSHLYLWNLLFFILFAAWSASCSKDSEVVGVPRQPAPSQEEAREGANNNQQGQRAHTSDSGDLKSGPKSQEKKHQSEESWDDILKRFSEKTFTDDGHKIGDQIVYLGEAREWTMWQPIQWSFCLSIPYYTFSSYYPQSYRLDKYLDFTATIYEIDKTRVEYDYETVIKEMWKGLDWDLGTRVVTKRELLKRFERFYERAERFGDLENATYAGEPIKAYYLDVSSYCYNCKKKTRYIISPDVPLLANPLFIREVKLKSTVNYTTAGYSYLTKVWQHEDFQYGGDE